ncbi:hypothetical protein CCHL11_09791, partial [Colletotrichum chlorophyti]
IELWNGLDVNVGLIIACLPTLRPYFSHWRKLRLSRPPNGVDPKKRSGDCSEVSEMPGQDHPHTKDQTEGGIHGPA